MTESSGSRSKPADLQEHALLVRRQRPLGVLSLLWFLGGSTLLCVLSAIAAAQPVTIVPRSLLARYMPSIDQAFSAFSRDAHGTADKYVDKRSHEREENPRNVFDVAIAQEIIAAIDKELGENAGRRGVARGQSDQAQYQLLEERQKYLMERRERYSERLEILKAGAAPRAANTEDVFRQFLAEFPGALKKLASDESTASRVENVSGWCAGGITVGGLFVSHWFWWLPWILAIVYAAIDIIEHFRRRSVVQPTNGRGDHGPPPNTTQQPTGAPSGAGG